MSNNKSIFFTKLAGLMLEHKVGSIDATTESPGCSCCSESSYVEIDFGKEGVYSMNTRFAGYSDFLSAANALEVNS